MKFCFPWSSSSTLSSWLIIMTDDSVEERQFCDIHFTVTYCIQNTCKLFSSPKQHSQKFSDSLIKFTLYNSIQIIFCPYILFLYCCIAFHWLFLPTVVKKMRKIPDAFSGFYCNLVNRRARGKLIIVWPSWPPCYPKSVCLIINHLSSNTCTSSVTPLLWGFQSSLKVVMLHLIAVFWEEKTRRRNCKFV